MAYVVEVVPKDQKLKYEEKTPRKFKGSIVRDDWAIDREKGFFLRQVWEDRQSYGRDSYWLFYYMDQMLPLDVSCDIEFGEDDSEYVRRKVKIEAPNPIRKEELLVMENEIRRAYAAYKISGIDSDPARRFEQDIIFLRD